MPQKNKILFLPKYPRLGASSRLRTYQYIPLWEDAGYQCTVAPFFNEQYLQERYGKERVSKRNVLNCYRQRWRILQTLEEYKLVVVEKELFPYLPFAWEKSSYHKKSRFIIDYDDAIFHNYDKHPWAWVRGILGTKIDKVMAVSEVVWAGNTYLAERSRRAGAKKVNLLPTVIDALRYPPNSGNNGKELLRIGWVGSPTTKRYLDGIRPALEDLAKKRPFTLNIIADGQDMDYSGNQESLVWSEAAEVDMIAALDIGIMPLEDSPWEQGKCAYKLIQYMACGLPVVASPVGMNKEVVNHGENGFLAKTKAEWAKYLEVLLEDAALRQKMGERGRKLVEEKYTLERNWEKIQEWMGMW